MNFENILNHWCNIEWNIDYYFDDEMCMNWFYLMMNMMIISNEDFDNEKRKSVNQYFCDIDFDDL